MKGGAIVPNVILKKITSIGFELESSNITPIKLMDSKLMFESFDKIVSEKVLRSTDTTFSDLETVFSKLTNSGLKSYPNSVVIYKTKPKHNCICCKPYCTIGCKCSGFMSLHKGRFKKESGKSNRERSQIIYHTEFKITYITPTIGEDVLLSHFALALNEITSYFSGASMQKVYLEDYPEKHVHLFKIKDGFDEFMTITEPKSSIIDINEDIVWHAQCTIGVKLENIQEVVLFLADNTVYDSTTLQQLHQKYIRYHKKQYKTSPSALENGFYFLSSMFDLKNVKKYNKTSNLDTDYRLAVRHPLIDVHDHFKDDMNLIKDHELPSDRLGDWVDNFADVGKIKFTGIVLIEMRDFYDQFLGSFKGWTEKDYPDGQSISFFNEGIVQLVKS
jgi:hypothetical protein